VNPAHQAPAGKLLLEAVDGLGLDADRLRSDAKLDNLYFTGIEFAVVIGMPIVIQFFQSVFQGAVRRATERTKLGGMTTDEMGEALGGRAVDAVAAALEDLGKRARNYASSASRAEAERKELIGSLDKMIEDELAGLRPRTEEEDVVAAGADIAAYLVERGLPEKRAEEVGRRIAEQIFEGWSR
jgi:hypothetical protein